MKDEEIKAIKDIFDFHKEQILSQFWSKPKTDVPDMNVGDTISRQAAIAIIKDCMLDPDDCRYENAEEINGVLRFAKDRIKEAPSAQPERRHDEWCTDCKEYDQEKHCCPRWNRVIRTTLQDAQRTGRWIPVAGRMGKEVQCDCCGEVFWYWLTNFTYCPNCGARMEVEE